ncbi:hypothetical protein AVEN_112453-1 [Araneus ventricosus]|uniref:Uncharacterized protein n=1 Tax=Araneus ventricosus TaxID=182803 RepID=A0A4Y2M3H7_ARAVE|nr:hypothetical protein AVEN_112453-1 [Araneus ventricosus]
MTPEPAPPSPDFCATPVRGRLIHDLRFNMHQAHILVGSWRNRVSSLEPSGPKAETIPLGHRGLMGFVEILSWTFTIDLFQSIWRTP